MLLLNTVDIFLFYFDGLDDFIASIIIPFSLILMSRLLINLREAAHRDVNITSASSPYFSSEFPSEFTSIDFNSRVEDGQTADQGGELDAQGPSCWRC